MASSACNRLKTLFTKTPKHISSTSTSSNSLPPEIQQVVSSIIKKSRFLNFRRNQHNYTSTIRSLAAGKHFSAIEAIVEDLKKYVPSSGEACGPKLIVLYGKAGMFDHACKVFDELPKLNCRRTVISFNALLSACVYSKNFDKVGDIFEELPEKLDLEPDIFSYNTVIKGFCELKDFESAVKLMEKMEDSPIRPDIVSYNTVLDAYCKENSLVEADKLLRRMGERGVIADVRTYNARLRSLIQNDQIDEPLKFVEKMVKEGVNPNTGTYNALIKGCVDNKDLERAKMLLGKMVGDGCCPDHTTYNMLISFACDEGDNDFALKLCKQAVELKVPVCSSSMELVVDSLLISSKIEEAKELVGLVNSSKKYRYTLHCQ